MLERAQISDLAAFLVNAVRCIAGAGTDMITIEGVTELHGADREVIPDRIEAGTYLVAGAITGGERSSVDSVPAHGTALDETAGKRRRAD